MVIDLVRLGQIRITFEKLTAEDQISYPRVREQATALKTIQRETPIRLSATATTAAPYKQEAAVEACSNLLTIGPATVHRLEFQLLYVLQAPLDRVQHVLRHHAQIREGTTNFAA